MDIYHVLTLLPQTSILYVSYIITSIVAIDTYNGKKRCFLVTPVHIGRNRVKLVGGVIHKILSTVISHTQEKIYSDQSVM